MGTTLTGTTPATTYDSLIKVTDNGPLSGTLKKLTDGLGNDSSLSLSTTAASLSGNLTSTGSASFTGSVASAISAGEQAILQGGYLQFYNAAATNKFIKLTDDASTIDGIGFSKSGAASTIWFPSGSVGIGTSSPTEKLDVIGGALAAGNGTIRTGITYSSLGLLGTFTNHDLGLITNGTEKARITAAGNVGIGTSSPAAKLDVNQTNQSGDNDFIRLTTDATSGSLSLGIYPSSGNSLSFIGSNALFSSGGVTRLNAGAGGSLLSMNTDSIAVYVSSGAANPVERMRIDSSGNVGIGTSAPAVKLDVAGRVNAAGDDYHSFSVDQGSAQIRLERTGTSTGVNYIGADNRGLLITDSAFSTLAIFTANGLTFNGDTAAANALDDYEEGTFTPTTAGDATGAFSGVLGEYTKIGNVVHFRIAATISTNFTSSDIGGLPFTIGGGGSPSGIVGLFSVANSSSGTLVARLDAATTTIKTYSDNNVNNPIAPSTAMLTLRVFGTYRV